MPLGPDISEKLARARADLRMGLCIVLHDGQRRTLVAAIETLSPDRLMDIQSIGDAVLAITERRAQTLKARAYDGDLARITMPEGASLGWLLSIAEPADDLMAPMKGPLMALREGDANPARAGLGLCKAARLLPAVVLVPVSDPSICEGLTVLPLDETLAELERPQPMHSVVSARLPLTVSEAGRLHVFRPDDGGEEHYAVEIGRPSRSEPVLSRLHSACFTGDLMGSLKCDCGPQLRTALSRIGSNGAGVLLYLNQEGRGIGLANKLRAYALQDQGFDTVEANHRLGFEDDERDFRLGAQILKEMGFSAVRLMTNNPAKVDMMERCGISVAERVPLKVGETEHNADYLATKAAKSGHLL